MSRVLIAEDEDHVRTFLARATLRILTGASVLEARNGLEALHLFQQSGADLILSDYRMPVMNGLDFCAGVRNLNNDVPFILISADGSIYDQALQVGVSQFLVKPIGFDDVRRILQTWLP